MVGPVARLFRCIEALSSFLLLTLLLLRFLWSLIILSQRRCGHLFCASRTALMMGAFFLLLKVLTRFAAFVITKRQGQLRAGECLGLRFLSRQVVIQLADGVEVRVHNDAVTVLALHLSHGTASESSAVALQPGPEQCRQARRHGRPKNWPAVLQFSCFSAAH